MLNYLFCHFENANNAIYWSACQFLCSSYPHYYFMSKPNIKFVYSGEIRSQVQELQKGPVPLDHFYGSFMRPQSPPPIMLPSASQIGSNVQVNSRTTIPSIVRHRSSDSIALPKNEVEFSPFLNIGQVQESKMQPSQKPPIPEPKKPNKPQNEQIVLKAPCYKYTPKGEGELAVRSKREYGKVGSVQKPLVPQSNLKSKKSRGAPLAQDEKDVQLRSSNPLLLVEAVKESDFQIDAYEPNEQNEPIIAPSKKNKNNQPAKQTANFDDQIVLKAPKYKFTPQDGTVRKKQYVKAQNSEKYLYQGVKTHKENDFVACFGCAKPTAKVYDNNEE